MPTLCDLFSTRSQKSRRLWLGVMPQSLLPASGMPMVTGLAQIAPLDHLSNFYPASLDLAPQPIPTCPGLAKVLATQPPALENTTTLVIQAMDLGLIVPLAILSGMLLLRGSPWGYLLASVTLMKGLTMGLAVSAMGINMALNEVAVSPAELLMFPLITLLNLAMAVLLLKHVEGRRPE